MERVLEKLAKQLCAYDQMSLMELWSKYEEKVRTFEPSREWEEAVVILSMIQSIRWKNQLFNYHMTAAASPYKGDTPPVFIPASSDKVLEDAPLKNSKPKKKVTILHFPKKTTSATPPKA